MIVKECLFSGSTELGPAVLPLFQRGTDAFFEKTASFIVPEVVNFIAGVRPENGTIYTLVNALGAGEYFGSNANADYFDESGLIHRPDQWAGDPALDAEVGRKWGYGFPTFYGAHVFPHHRNQDPAKSIGDVVFAAWNPRMRRVELVTKTHEARCRAQGVTSIWDKLKALEYADVSMGARVPGDLCSCHADWAAFEAAKKTYNPRVHANEGVAVAEYHKRSPIRGWAKTRKEYCENMLRKPNTILPDGKKVFVHNHYPKFFDISYVFVGADRTAKAMIHIRTVATISTPSESYKLGWDSTFGGEEKTAARKHGEIQKSDIPSHFVPSAVRHTFRGESDLPREVLHEIARHPERPALATVSGLGIVLRPREFQRIVLHREGNGRLADALDANGLVFPRGDAESPWGTTPEFIPELLRVLAPFLARRSALHEPLTSRILIAYSGGDSTPYKSGVASSYLFEPLSKMGSRYSEYRQSIMQQLPHAPHLLSEVDGGPVAQKLGSAPLHELFSPLTVEYLQSAFWEEAPLDPTTTRAKAGA
jgi:hypothetical protein